MWALGPPTSGLIPSVKWGLTPIPGSSAVGIENRCAPGLHPCMRVCLCSLPHLGSTYYVPGTSVGSGDVMVDEADRVSCSC